MAYEVNKSKKNRANALTGGVLGKGLGDVFESGTSTGDRLKLIGSGGFIGGNKGVSAKDRATSLFTGGLLGASGLFSGDQKNVERDPLGAQLGIDPNLLNQYLASPAGANAGALRGARVFQANDRPGYSPDPGITDLYAGFYNWMQEDKARVQAHEEYATLMKERPGRQATILGSDFGSGNSSNSSILGAGPGSKF